MSGLNVSLPDCVNTTLDNCYSFWYRNSDGSNNLFCNAVAGENIFALFYNIGTFQLGNLGAQQLVDYYQGKCASKLKDLANAESYSKSLLATIISQFDNGIGAELDKSVISAAVENLISLGCMACIDDFLAIVCLNTKATSDRKNNRKLFYDFAQDLQHKVFEKSCQHKELHKWENPVKTKAPKSIWRRGWEAFSSNWLHPFHWTNFIYMACAFGFTIGLSWGLPLNARAGAFWGDLSNCINSFVIPSYPIFNVFQKLAHPFFSQEKYINKDISKRVRTFDINLHIFSLVVGKMDNGIKEKPARGFLELLMLLGWPPALVNEFAELASRNGSDYSDLREDIRQLLRKQNITYEDGYTRAALSMKKERKDGTVALSEDPTVSELKVILSVN